MSEIRTNVLPATQAVALLRPGVGTPADPAVHPLKPAADATTATTHPRQSLPEIDNLQARFEYDRALHQIIIKLVREETGEVVTQIPSEKVQSLILGLLQRMGMNLDVRG